MKKVKEGYFADRYWYDWLQRFLLFFHPVIDRDKILASLAYRKGQAISRNYLASLTPLKENIESSLSLSLVITCYNYGQYLLQILENVKQQTFTDFEIILVNDGSDDLRTLNVLSDLKHNQDLKSIDIPHQGPAGAKNSGMAAAKGRYICCLDADDLLEPTYFAKALQVLENRPDVDLVYSWVQCFGDKNELQQKADLDVNKIIHHNQVSPGAILRRSCWEESGGYKPEMNSGLDDWEFWINLAELGKKGFCLPEPLYLHREHSQSLTARINREKREAELKAMIKQLHPALFSYRQENQQQILVLAPESLGDLILSLPLLEGLRAYYPQSRITVIVSPGSSQVLEHHPVPDQLLLFDFSWDGKKRRQFLKSLKQVTFDLLFCLPAAVKYYQLAGKFKAQKKIGYYYPVMWVGNIVSRLVLNIRVCCSDNRHKPDQPLKHEMSQYLELLKVLGWETSCLELNLSLNQQALAWAETFLQERRYNSIQSLLGIQLDFKLFSQPKHWRQLCANIKQNFPEFELLFFAYREKEQGLAIELPESVIQAENLNFDQWAALIKRCRVLLSFDGGALHVASALKVPVIAVFPERNFAFNSAKWYPWGVPYRMIVKSGSEPEERINAKILTGLKELIEGQSH